MERAVRYAQGGASWNDGPRLRARAGRMARGCVSRAGLQRAAERQRRRRALARGQRHAADRSGSGGLLFEAMQLRALLSEAAAAWSGLDGVPELLVGAGVPGPAGLEGGNGVYLVEDWTLQENILAIVARTARWNWRSPEVLSTA
jgi:hypothetical protein